MRSHVKPPIPFARSVRTEVTVIIIMAKPYTIPQQHKLCFTFHEIAYQNETLPKGNVTQWRQWPTDPSVIRFTANPWGTYADFGYEGEVPFPLCGVFAKLLDLLASRSGQKLLWINNLPPPELGPDVDRWFYPYDMLGENTLDIYLWLTFGQNYEELVKSVTLTRPIGIMYDAAILARRDVGEKSSFLYFMAFTEPVWLLIGISLVLMSFHSALISKALHTERSNMAFVGLWDYTRVLLEEPVREVPRSHANQLLLGVWFLTTMVLQSAWSGGMFDYIIRPPTWIKVESLEDLSKRHDLVPVAFKYETGWEYIRSRCDEVARSMDPRTLDFEYDGVEFEKQWQIALEQVGRGEIAMISELLAMTWNRNRMLTAGWTNTYVTQDLNAMFTKPYFLSVNKKSAEWLLPPLNNL